MKAKVLFGAVALLSTFAACSNEELATVVNESNLNDSEVVGANLVAQGMNITLGNGIESRVNAEGWESTDQLAMAWYNVETSISTEQTETNWAAAAGTDYNIYANHLFSKGDGENFVTKSNIYEGAHFIYFPYEYMSKVASKTVNVNAKPQANSFDYEVLNEALYVSASDFVNEEDLNKTTGVLEKEFVISPVVNVLKANVKAEDDIRENEFLGSLQIAKQSIYVNGTANFRTKGTIIPQKIARVVRYTTGENAGEIDRAETFKALEDGANDIISASEANSNSLATEITYAMPLSNDENVIRAFTLPTHASGSPTDAQFTYTMTKDGYLMGKFITNISSKDVTNKATAGKMKDLTTEAGWKKDADAKAYTLTKLIAGNGKATPVGLDINLLISEFHADYTISNLEEWNLTVDMVDALNSLKGEDETKIVPVFELSNDITFDGGEIRTPAAGVNVTGKSMVIASNVVWPTNLSGNVSVIVEPNATVAVNSNANNGVGFYLKNGSVINMNEEASEIKLANDTEGSRININKYGAKVELSSDLTEGIKNTIVAYNLPKGYMNYQVNNLMRTDEPNKKFARINTIVVGEGVVFELTEKQKGAPVPSDPYTGENDPAYTEQAIDANLIMNVDIEMNGGTIQNGEVANIIALAGTTSTVIDVNSDNITLEEGAKLTITTDEELDEDDEMVVIRVKELTINKGATITADNVVVEYTNWTNLGISQGINNGILKMAATTGSN